MFKNDYASCKTGNSIITNSRWVTGILCCGVVSACANSSTSQTTNGVNALSPKTQTLSVAALATKQVAELSPQMKARVQRVKTRVLDVKSTSRERLTAFNQLGTLGLTTPQKLPIYREVALLSIDRDVAFYAVRTLMLADDPALFQVLDKRFKWLNVTSVGHLCSEYLQRYPLVDSRFFPYARHVVQKSILLSKAQQGRDFTTADGPLMMLAMSEAKEDKNLIRMALSKMPERPAAWFAASYANAMTSKERALGNIWLQKIQSQKFVFTHKDAHPAMKQMARAIFEMQQKMSQIPVRVALADEDKKSADFLHKRMKQFVSRFGSLTGDAAITAGMDSLNEDNSSENGDILMWRLRFLNVPFEQNPISQCLDVKNELIRAQAYLVVADRYPQVIFDRLRDGKFNLNDKELEAPGFVARLITFCGIKHPEYSQQSKDAISEAERKKALDELQKKGIYVFGSGVRAFLGL